MGALNALVALVARTMREWWSLRDADLQYAELNAAVVWALAALGAGLVTLLWRMLMMRRRRGRRTPRGIAPPGIAGVRSAVAILVDPARSAR